MPRTATANDCVPVFPAIPAIRGINIAKTATCSNVSSNFPIKLAVNMPRKSKIISHGSLFFADSIAESFDHSSSETAASLE